MGIPNIDLEVGKRLKTLRKIQDLTQADLAEMLLCGQDLISMYERGVRRLTDTKILLLVERFGLSEKWLLTGEGQMYDSIMKQLGLKSIEINRIVEKIIELDTNNLLLLESVIDAYTTRVGKN